MDRIGEENYNNFGSKMRIVGYRGARDIDVYFPKYDYTTLGCAYKEFQKGSIRCPYEPRVYGVGYLGIGKYKTKENKKHTKCYDIWNKMLRRCYVVDDKNFTYKDCTVCEEWHNFQNFAKWYEENYYEVDNEVMDLDKDIICKGNKVYCPQYCVFVPHRINSLFIKRQNDRGEYPIGVTYGKKEKKFKAQCNDINGKRIYLGCFNNPIDAFNEYKRFKEKIIKQVAEEYKDIIPHELYKAMYKYEVHIND